MHSLLATDRRDWYKVPIGSQLRPAIALAKFDPDQGHVVTPSVVFIGASDASLAYGVAGFRSVTGHLNVETKSMRSRNTVFSLFVAALFVLLLVQTAYAGLTATVISGPTPSSPVGSTWTVTWVINVTNDSNIPNNSNNICIRASRTSPAYSANVSCASAAGNNISCSLTGVPNDSSVTWSLVRGSGSPCNNSVTLASGTITPLAVELAAFSAAQQQAAIVVTWETTSELNHRGFNVWRSDSPDAPTTRLNDLLIAPQSPGGAAGHLYTWEDSADLVAGRTYYYWLEALETGGAVEQYGPVAVDYRVPTAVTLHAMQAGAQPPAQLIALMLVMMLIFVSVIGTNRARTSFDRRS